MSDPILELRIVNATSLPDGGPLSVQVRPGEILEVGRESLGWNLPDPNCWISGRHLEVRFENGAWMLYDPSRNGTFVNGANVRVRSPYRLESGDQLQVGPYLIVAKVRSASRVAGDWAEPAPAAIAPGPKDAWVADSKSGIWSMGASVAEPDRGPAPERFVAPSAGSWPVQEPSRAGPHLASPVASVPPADRGAAFGRPGASAPFPEDPPLHRPLPPAPSPQPEKGPGQNIVQDDGARAVLEAIGTAAGLPAGVLTRNGDPALTATEIGQALRSMAEELASLLKVRALVRRKTRASNLTTIERDRNNPLKFLPTPEEALETMFGMPRPGYQRGSDAIRAGFADLKRHQYATQAAIPKALARLLEDLAPEAVEKRLGGGGLFGRKARAWETYVERWDAKVQAHENGMLDVFMILFSEAYDEHDRKDGS